MKVRDLIVTLLAIDEVSVLDSDVFFLIKGEDNTVEVNEVTYDDEGNVILTEGENKQEEDIDADSNNQAQQDK